MILLGKESWLIALTHLLKIRTKCTSQIFLLCYASWVEPQLMLFYTHSKSACLCNIFVTIIRFCNVLGSMTHFPCDLNTVFFKWHWSLLQYVDCHCQCSFKNQHHSLIISKSRTNKVIILGGKKKSFKCFFKFCSLENRPVLLCICSKDCCIFCPNTYLTVPRFLVHL